MDKEIHKKTFTTSDDCAIAYTLRPARKPGAPRLALIHSLALDGSIWDGVAARLAGQAEILTYDCRGHGQSERTAESFTAELVRQRPGGIARSFGLADRRCRGMLDGRLRRAGVCRPESLPRERAWTDRHDGVVR